jgi:hypothetical protein
VLDVLRVLSGLLAIGLGGVFTIVGLRAARRDIGADRFGSILGAIGAFTLVLCGIGLVFGVPWLAQVFAPDTCAWCN